MKLSKNIGEGFIEKIETLKKIKIQLKSEFIGLDEIIDEIIDLIEPWYLFPKIQLKPTVINLWGMTGVGKTSLIVRLFELLKINTYKFDIGDYTEASSDTKLKYHIYDSVAKFEETDKMVFLFDEFQLGRTKDDFGGEIDRPALRILWELFDTGKIELLRTTHESSKLFLLAKKLSDVIGNGVTAINGVVTTNKNYFWNTFGKPSANGIDDSGDDSELETLIIPASYNWTFAELMENDFDSYSDVSRKVKTFNEIEALNFVNKALEFSLKPIVYDFSNAIIFNVGNIDDAYRMSDDISPDADADVLYEYTSKITLPEIKNSLLKYYRPEQLSRLGNSHIIYKSFSSKMYKDLINLRLNSFKNKLLGEFELELIYDTSLFDILYCEGVFPTQGTRPIFSTISSLVESYLGKIISDIIKNEITSVTTLHWSYSDKTHKIKYLNDNEELLIKEYPVTIKTDSLREIVDSEYQALVAVHEAGHAICSICSSGILPKRIISKTADYGSGGSTLIEYPEYDTAKLIEHKIIAYLGGYAAEKFVFGSDNISSGSSLDLKEATNLALSLVKRFGMTDIIGLFGESHIENQYKSLNSEIFLCDEKAFKILDNCLTEAKKIIEREHELLFQMSNYLVFNNSMNRDLIKEYYEKYGLFNVTYKTKENYFNFKEKLGKLK